MDARKIGLMLRVASILFMILALASLMNVVHDAIVLRDYWGMDWNLFWSGSAMFGWDVRDVIAPVVPWAVVAGLLYRLGYVLKD